MKAKFMGIGLVVILIGIFSLTACNSHTERPPDPERYISHGEKIYIEFCAECHQVDGTGYTTLFPRLAGNPIVTLHDAEPIILTVKYGQGSMPAFGPRLNPDEIAAVLSYIRNAWGNQAPAISKHQIN